MRNGVVVMMVAALGFGCAGAGPVEPVGPAAAAPEAARPQKPIPDQEPEVTTQVGEILAQYANGTLAPQRLTERAGPSVLPDQAGPAAARLRAYGDLDKMELLERGTDGEDRLYRYRARYRQGSAMVDITFNKGGKIARLQVRPE